MTLRDGSPIRGCPWESRVYLYPIQSFSFPPSPDVEPLFKVASADYVTLRAEAESQTNFLRRFREKVAGAVGNAEPLAMVKVRADRAESRIHAAIQAMARHPAELQTAEATLTQNSIALDVLGQIVTRGLRGPLGEHACHAERLIREATILVRASPHDAAALSELAATFDACQPPALQDAFLTLKEGISRLQDPRAAAGDAMPTPRELSNGLTRPLTEAPDPLGGTRAPYAVRWNEMTLKIAHMRAMYGELDERSPGLCNDVKTIEDAYAQMTALIAQGRRPARRQIESVHSGCDQLLKHLSPLVAIQRQGPASIHQR